MADESEKMGNKPSPLDIHFGNRLQLRRRLLDVDKRTLGRMVGLSARDIDALEGGRSCFDATLVYKLSKALEVPIYWFYDGIGMVEDTLLTASTSDPVRTGTAAAKQIEQSHRARALLMYFEGMSSERQRMLLELARMLSTGNTELLAVHPN